MASEAPSDALILRFHKAGGLSQATGSKEESGTLHTLTAPPAP